MSDARNVIQSIPFRKGGSGQSAIDFIGYTEQILEPLVTQVKMARSGAFIVSAM